jgi:twitching motility protein PilT
MSAEVLEMPVAEEILPGQHRTAYIDHFFHYMIENKASDLHLSSECTPTLRIDGSMRPMKDYPAFDAGTLAGILYEIMPERNREQFATTSDTDFAYEIPGLARFRCNVFMDRKGMGGVFRVIPSKILSCDDLGIPGPVKNLCFLTKGLVLVTGPTGSGKSTTLAAMMDLVNATREDHIITIEDPIEFVHQNKKCLVNQREIGVHSKSFKAALKAALREDPDIVLVGEMRDLETIAIAIETAETGHLVFGTLHTTTAASTVDRIIDQFPTAQQNQVRMMLSESLKGVISQTLLKKKGGGRVAALEILLGASSVSNLIREGKTFQIPSVMQTSSNLGMQTLNDAIMGFVRRRTVDPLEAYMKAVDKAGIIANLEEAGIKLDLAKIAETAKAKSEDEDFWAE